MTSYRSTAAGVAESKRKHPDQFCPVDRCLWRTGGGRCPRHPAPEEAIPVAVDEEETTPIRHETGEELMRQYRQQNGGQP